jgi:hypothetical protein
MALQGSGTITMSQINTENTSTASNSLKTLSDTAKSGSDPADGAPYAMSEFFSYNHGPSTQVVTYTSSGPSGKISAYTTTGMSPTTMPFGSYALSSFASNGSGYFRIIWSGGLNTGWTSLSIGGITLTRTSANSTNSTTHFFSSSLTTVGSGSATFTYP